MEEVMNQEKRQYGKGFQLQGQAAVWQVASQLALRGHNVLFPGLDTGYDLQLENGLRLQIKSATITYKNEGYQRSGAYGFGLRRGAWDRKSKSYTRNKHENFRPYSEVAHYFVLWGVDENRFFILPTSHKAKAIWFTRRGAVSKSMNKVLFDRLMEERRVQYEDRWDLLDVGAMSRSLIESSVDHQVLESQGETNATNS
jgi:hypothetical protein